ncbi:hypothetical protein NW762_013658 [Fusarium torreyae]|uniref:Uncharacterized protein n=1 Tax=Fusarium torreyae TaxID=1237075 RepID=A0A9W8RN70_9HYPO|nr:hypothetical protein NW762_013658 [Fusarium torreyae]
MPDPDMPTPIDTEAPAEWRDPLPNDRFSYFHTETTTLILKTLDEHILNSSNTFSTNKLHIYAETIRITEDVTFPGKELGLFCHKLEIDPKNTSIAISVSGTAGINGISGAPMGDQNHGHNGGKIILSVEEWNDAHTPTLEKTGLFLRAIGGDGGQGAMTLAEGNTIGGNGGNGGNGGTINVYFGHPLTDSISQVKTMVADPTLQWSAKARFLKAYDFKDKTINENLNTRIDQSTALATKIGDIKVMVMYQSLGKTPTADASSNKDRLLKAVKLFEGSKQEPKLTDATLATIDGCYGAIDNIRQLPVENVTPEQWKAFTESAGALSAILEAAVGQPWNDGESPVGVALSQGLTYLSSKISEISDNMLLLYSCAKGQAGMGGSGATSSAQRGEDGKPGVNGDFNVRALGFNGTDDYLTIPDAIVHPDQCQMLLNLADLQYFTASGGVYLKTIKGTTPSDWEEGKLQPPEAFKEPRSTYEKIKKRLVFVTSLLQQVKNVGDVSKLDETSLIKFALYLSYGKMAQEKLSMDPLSQFYQLQMHAAQRIDWINTGKDFMGHYGRWVPRLNYNYYSSQLAKYIVDAVDFAKEWENAYTERIPQAQSLETAQKKNEMMLTGLKMRIDLLTAQPNGDLPATASQIKVFTPLLKKKRLDLTASLENARKEVTMTVNFDFRNVLDALAMVAFAPCPFNIGVQTGNVLYEAATTVTGADGQQVEKRYVVQQFGRAGTTLSDLEEGFKNRSDGSLEVDDPGAMKLLSSKADLDKLIENFKKQLGDQLYAKIKFQLQEYVALITMRNNAVMSYNNSVQLLAKAYADQQYYAKRAEKTGQAILSMDPRAPYIRLWLTKCRQDLRTNILMALYRGERALQFWGLGDDLAPIPAAEDFSDIQLLQQRDRDFAKMFEDVLQEQAKNPGSIFPNPDHPEVGGRCFYLSKDLCKHFVENPTMERQEPMNEGDTPVAYKKHQIFFSIPAARRNTSKTESDFSNRGDVRVDSVRIWLFGATVEPDEHSGKRELTVLLEHCGNDSIVRPRDDKVFEFVHDAVLLTFNYDPSEVTSFAHTAQAKSADAQRLPSFRSIRQIQGKEVETAAAPFGPFADWRLTVSEQNNLGLKFSPDLSICVEFWGESRPFPA